MIRVFAFFLLITSCIAHLTYQACPTVYPMLEYDLKKATGKWYEIKRYRNIYETSEKCSHNNVTFLGDGRIIYSLASVHHESGSPIEWIARSQSILDDTDAIGNLEFSKYDVTAHFSMTALDTDYDNYQVLTGCRVVHGRRSEVYVWIESRNRTLDPMYMDKAYQVLLYNGLPTSQLESVYQENCPTA